jgi:hypothetical protein
MKCRIDHGKRPQDPVFQELLEGYTGHDFYEVAEHIRSLAVVPGCAGLGDERQLATLLARSARLLPSLYRSA